MAVVAPVRALLTAHLQASWNRSQKELGQAGRLVYALVMVLAFGFGALPLVAGSAAAGFILGRQLAEPSTAIILGGILGAMTLLGGLVGGISGGSRVLAWESTRVFPLRLRSLFAAELLAGLGDLLPMAITVATTFLLLGVAAAHPLLLPFLVLPWLGTVLATLCLQHLVASLAAQVVKNLQLGLLVLGIFLWVGSVLLPAQASKARLEAPGTPASVQRIQQALHTAAKVVRMLPSSQSMEGAAEASKGRWVSALERQVYPFALLVLLLLATARTLQREADPRSTRTAAKGTKEKLWGFTSPVRGVARLHWHSLLGSHLGKFGFLIPLMTLVILLGPLAQAKGLHLWGVPLAFAYVAMTGNQMQLNQFGLDGSGVKALLLLPIPAQDLLAGKALGLGAYMGTQALLLLALLGVTGHLGPLEAFAGLCLAGCLFLVQTGLGHWTSAWMPRTMPRYALKNANQAQLVIWLGMGISSLCAGLFGGLYVLVAWLAPALLVPVMLLVLGLVVQLYRRVLLPTAAGYLETRREALVQALG